MSLMEQTVKCPICGKPYKVMAFYAGDQSACRSCVQEAEQSHQWQQGDPRPATLSNIPKGA